MMRKWPMLCLMLLCASVCHAEEQKTAMTGTLSGVTGVVEIMKRGTTAWVQAANGEKIGTGDQINTGIDGNAVLKFENSVTEIKPLTQFTLGRAMEDKKEFSTEMFLSVGKIKSKADQVGGKTNRFTVTTPTAVAGIRGTQQEISFGEGFGTECKIEDGSGYMAPVDVAKLPPAVQMLLGVAPASPAASSGGGKTEGPGAGPSAPGATGAGAGRIVSEAATSAAGSASASPPGAVAEAVSGALDKWLESSFDNQVAGEEGEGAGPAEGGPEAGEEAAPEEPPPLLDEQSAAGEEIEIGDGQSAAIEDPQDVESIVDPTETLLQDAATDITAAGTTESELEAALSTTEISDAPPSELAVEDARSEDLAEQILEETIQEIGGTTGEVDLFGPPPAHP